MVDLPNGRLDRGFRLYAALVVLKDRFGDITERLPLAAQNALRSGYALARTRQRVAAGRAFRHAVQSHQPQYRPVAELTEFAARCPARPDYGYEPAVLSRRGKQRSIALLRFRQAVEAHDYLELGCWDGMVGAALSRAGKHVIGVDRTDAGFDGRALDAGAQLLVMDAEHLNLATDSVDFAYSYDAFEHFPHPDRVLDELARVVRPGGHVWVEFGPLYMSPFGAHIYRKLPVPYSHYLWPQAEIDDYVERTGFPPVDWSYCNGWRISGFRGLFGTRGEWAVERYSESVELDHLNLVRRWPELFKSHTTDFNDLIVSHIRAFLRRR
jgi:SAM-dependent methyltransferase